MGWQKRTGIMLCQPLDEHNLDRNFKIAPKMLVQPKLDGQRAWVNWVYPHGARGEAEPILVSSQGNIITGVPHVNIALKEMARKTGEHPSWDGELYYHGMPFEEIVSRTKRLPNNLHPRYLDIQYHIFDVKSALPNLERQEYISKHLHEFNRACSDELRYILRLVVANKAERHEIEIFLEYYLNQGFEGIIIRNPVASYVEKRPYTILKWKPSLQDWYKIKKVGEALSEQGQPLGLIGWLECEDRYGNSFRVGSGLGLDNSKKTQLWQERDTLLGKFACVKYQNLTKYGVPRFGKFTSVSITAENGERESW